MATEVARLRAYLDADTSSFDRKMRQSETTTQRFGRIAKGALIGGAAAGLYALGKAAKIGWDEYNQGQKVAAQTNAVLKSTGHEAGVSAKHVEELGEALMRKSGIDDEVIKSGENVLLTFTKIRNEAGKNNDIFDQTTKIALDMSVALGQDLQSSMIQVGKAMNTPTVGLTALRRVGVSFSDSQTELIKKLDESGQTMKAQKLILQELQKEFGGSAEAAGKTFAGQINILHERLNNFLGDLVGKAIPYLERFAKWLDPRVTKATQLVQQTMQQWQKTINEVFDALGRQEKALHDLGVALDVVGKVMSTVIKIQLFWARVVMKVWVTEIKIVMATVRALISAFNFLRSSARTVFNAVSGYILGPINRVRELIGWVQDAIGWFKNLIGISNSNAGSSIGAAAGAAAGGGRPTGTAQRTTAPRFAPRAAAVGDINLQVNVDGERLFHIVRRRGEQWERRGGR